MKVLDASFLIDYLSGVEATKSYLEANDGETFVVPSVALGEVLVGEGNGPENSNIDAIRDRLGWAEIASIDEQTAVDAAKIADEVGPQGPYLAGSDAVIAAIGREFGAPVVSSDRDLTHEAVKEIVAVEEYR